MMMVQRILITVAIGTALLLSSRNAYSQFGGVQLQIGGYGNGGRIGNLSYGNGFYGNGYGNPYYGNYGYGSRYGNYSNGYYNNGFGYNNYPNSGYRYTSPRVYSSPMRSYSGRRYRYR
jgi:hypothetical protein